MCRVFRTWTHNLLDNPWAEPPEALSQHMAICDECRARWAVARRLAEVLQAWPEPEPAASPKSIAERVLADRREQQQARMRNMLAASLVLAVLAWFGLSALQEPQPEVPSYRVAIQLTPTITSTEVATANQPSTNKLEHRLPDVRIAQAQPGEAISDSTAYSVQELAYWFMPESVRRSVEDMVEVVSPVITSDSASDTAVSLSDVVPVNWGNIEQLWHPLRDVSQNSLRLFRSIVPTWSQEPNS
ncbi:MAG: hypothetical protein RMJ19_12180 [Gemmatales bacterium]|nr:hypothetical protein [Gemmatales bacterium]MDW8176424.1 hypothetical protein [Gemmatales bacterium]